MRLSPLTPRFGALVDDVDLNRVTETRLFPELRAAFETHSALLFRGQDLTPEAHVRIAGLLGPIEDRRADEREKGAAFEIPEVSNVAADGSVLDAMDLGALTLKANMLWHSDSTFMPTPALSNLLAAQVVTAEGGATELASTRAAFQDMAPERQAELRRARLVHHYAHSRARISRELAAQPMFHKWPPQAWPAVWRNPVNGLEAVYVASHAYAVLGADLEDDADAQQRFIDTLIAACTQPQYVYAHQWAVGDVLLWDQRAVLHRGTPWPEDQPRTLRSICSSATDADGLSAMRAAAPQGAPPYPLL